MTGASNVSRVGAVPTRPLTVSTIIGLAPAPVGVRHFAEVPEIHTAVPHRLAPSCIVIERSDSPKFTPLSVRDWPLLVGTLAGPSASASFHTFETVGESYVNSTDGAVPTSAAIVTRAAFEPLVRDPDPGGAEQTSCVSDVHESVLHAVPASVSMRADDEMSASPKFIPARVSKADPVVGELPRPKDATGASNVKAALSEPTCDVTVRATSFADPVMSYTILYRLHCIVVVDVHDAEPHDVVPRRADAVISFAPAKLRPEIVTTDVPDVSVFIDMRYDATGASKEKTATAVPTKVAVPTTNAACRDLPTC
jgi:hypothetical protein